MPLNKNSIRTLLGLCTVAVTSACDSTQSGIFVDAPVAGLSYLSMPSQTSGITDSDGRYLYESGDSSITFTLGGLQFGDASADSIISPIDLIVGGDISDTRVLNITRTMMMLDSDGNPDNGIVISSAVQTAAASWSTPDFSSTSYETDISSILADVESADGRIPVLPDSATAQAHLSRSLRCQYSGMFKGSFDGTKEGWGRAYDGKVRYVVDGNGEIDGYFRGEGDWLIPNTITALTLDTKSISADFGYTGYLFGNAEGTYKYVRSCTTSGLPCITGSALDISFSGTDRLTGTSSATWSDGVTATSSFGANRGNTGVSNVIIRGVSTADWYDMGATSGLFLMEIDERYNVRVLALAFTPDGNEKEHSYDNAIYDPQTGTISGDTVSGSIDLSAGTFSVTVESIPVSGTACSLN
ncbi:MAG: hypothetical protein HUJ29_03680 [Gammaproteobacteria bacterium]|nr:hypothetical protein [Gammaproteobacteria bacterium]